MEFLILNDKFECVDILDTYESFIWTDRFYKCGDFQCVTIPKKRYLETLVSGNYIQSYQSEHLMIIEQKEIKTSVEVSPSLTIKGRSLESILDRRIVWKQTILDGKLQGQIKKILNDNVVNPSDSSRKIENFIFEEADDPNIIDLTIQAQYTGDNLYDVICEICESFNIGFKITLNEDNNFVFKLYSGTDRSYSQNINQYVVFSPDFDNIIDTRYNEDVSEYKNVALIAGEGEGSDRKTLVIGSDTLSGLNRKELYVDARDIFTTTDDGQEIPIEEYTEQLRQRGISKLSEWIINKVFDGQIESTRMYEYQKDFFIGDIIQLENEFGIASGAQILEFITSIDSSGVDSYPTFEIIEKEGD